MSSTAFPIRKAAVLGAGVMGAQIAAHLVNAGVPVILFDLAAKEGDPNGIVAEGARRTREARAVAARECGRARLHRRRELRPGPRATRRVRPRDRGDRRADGLEARSLREDRAAPRAARDRRVEHVRALDQRARGRAARGGPAAVLRNPLLQPAALHAPGRTDRAGSRPTRRSSTRSRRSSSRRSARASSAPRTRRTSSPTGSASSRCWRRWRTPRPSSSASTSSMR